VGLALNRLAFLNNSSKKDEDREIRRAAFFVSKNEIQGTFAKDFFFLSAPLQEERSQFTRAR